jgi:RNA polymerase sigma factor (TIGR02999 family)
MKRANNRPLGRQATEGSEAGSPPAVGSEAPEGPPTITELLHDWARGSAAAEGRLFDRIYPELRKIAAARMRGAGRDLSLAPTEIVHETYLRLMPQRGVTWANREQFFAVSARIVRRVLIDQLRRRRSRKRGGAAIHVSIDEIEIATGRPSPDLLALDALLEELDDVDPAAVRLIELRYFAGLTVDAAAATLGISRTSAVCKWRAARAWLRQRLLEGEADGS